MELVNWRTIATRIEAIAQVVRQDDAKVIIDLVDCDRCQDRVGKLVMRLIKRRKSARAQQQPKAP